MKFYAFSLFAIALSPPLLAEPPSNIQLYKICVQQNVLKFERAKEPASDTVDAAIGACENMRIKFRSDMLGKWSERSVFTASGHREATYSLWDRVAEAERRDALVKVLEIRSARKKKR